MHACVFLCTAHAGSTSERRLLHQQHHTHVSWYSCERSSTDTEDKLLNKVFILLSLYTKIILVASQKKGILTMSLLPASCVAVYGGSESSWISSKIS